jgi:hypothetical protein
LVISAPKKHKRKAQELAASLLVYDIGKVAALSVQKSYFGILKLVHSGINRSAQHAISPFVVSREQFFSISSCHMRHATLFFGSGI